MTIGTAAPSPEELSEAKHYFIQDRSVRDHLSAGKFEKEALKVLNKLFLDNDCVILVGGSALYEKTVTEGFHDLPKIPDHIREVIKKNYESKGLTWLKSRVQMTDPEYYATIDTSNSRRLIRALEVFETSNSKLSDLQKASLNERPFNVLKVGLHADRELLYERINKRVDHMMANGLLEEAIPLKKLENQTVKNTVGYQELFPYLDGHYDLNEAIRLIKRNSRRFAKRQMTWYRKDQSIHWFDFKTRHTEIVQRVSKLMEKQHS